MTREEAIKAVKETTIKLVKEVAGMSLDWDDAHYDALQMAIKALEQEPCEDAVSKASVFEIMGNLMSIPYDFDRPITEKDVSESMDEVKALPPVTPIHTETVTEFADRCIECGNRYGRLLKQATWIPVSERLPEDFQRVLVTIVNYNGDKVVRVAEYSRRTFKIKENYEHWQVGEKGLLAWMPLPEPYKEETEGEVCKGCHYNDGEVHAECVVCDKAEMESEE